MTRCFSRMWAAAAAALYLTAAIPGAVGQIESAAHYFVDSLPGQPEGPLLRQHAGHIEVDPDHHGKLFFWRFENRHIANRHRTVFWLNGGPGCSSEDGALMEIGPYRLKDSKTLEYNEGSWDEFANLVFVDNPVGTGFSSIDSDSYIHELGEMADQMITFMEKYFKVFPEDATNDIYIAGESYAGQHIPYIAQAILKRNSATSESHAWLLKGLLIGNGWISPVDQGPSYLEYAYKSGMIKKDSSIAASIETQQQQCLQQMKNTPADEPRISYPSCEAVLNQILEKTAAGGQCYNMYDVRLKDSLPACGMNWPPDLVDVIPYLQRDDVTHALHVDEDKLPGWVECNGNVGNAFHPHKSKPAVDLMPEILKEVPVVLFSGDQDLICNHLGTETMIHNMEWNGGKGFEISPKVVAPRQDWTFEGEPAGIYQQARNLTYVLFYNSSHMVGFDYPRRTRAMLDMFMGVDIASVGGTPAESLLDGEPAMPITSVGGHPNSTAAQEAEEQKLEDERWSAYYRSGAVALIVVAILAACFGWYVWQDRRRRAGYRHVNPGDGFMRRDLETADFDEGELDELTRPDERKYSLGDEPSDDEAAAESKKLVGMNGHGNGVSK